MSLAGVAVDSFTIAGKDMIRFSDDERTFLDNYIHKINSVRLGNNLASVLENDFLSDAA